MNINLSGKVAIVTGGVQGMGLKCAEELAASGAKVAVVDRQSEAKIAQAVKGIQKKGTAKGYQLDVTRISEIASTVKRIRKEMGEIDILVCCAGIALNPPQPAQDITEAQWDAIQAVNVKGLFFCNQAVAIQSMIPRKSGAIVNIASQVGLVGCKMCIPYNTSKAAVVQITRAEALEWADYNIRVNAVAPQWVRTPLSDSLFEGKPEWEAEEIAKVPLHRIATVDEIAPAICFLASGLASMITGITLPVDGGWTAQ